KKNVPVIISETHEETKPVFLAKAREMDAPITFADENWKAIKISELDGKTNFKVESESEFSHLTLGLNGNYQKYNLPGILESVSQMRRKGWNLPTDAVLEGFENVAELTGLKGRWQTLSTNPLVICDTGHNEAGFREILSQLETYSYKKLWMVLGMVQDKDISKVL